MSAVIVAPREVPPVAFPDMSRIRDKNESRPEGYNCENLDRRGEPIIPDEVVVAPG